MSLIATASSSPAARPAGPYRVMICDDSAVIRGLIARDLESDPDIHIVAAVGDGKQAIDTLHQLAVEVCILDVEMPVMDGLTALPRMIELRPDLQVIVASTLTLRNAEISLKALANGAADYLTKPSTGHQGLAADDFRIELVAKVKALAASRRRIAGVNRRAGAKARADITGDKPAIPAITPYRRLAEIASIPAHGFDPVPAASDAHAIRIRPDKAPMPEIIAIGSSTGGPQALFSLLSALKGFVSQAIIVTQHMPPTFTAILADHITRRTGIKAIEAIEGIEIKRGHVYVAPGDFHLTLRRDGSRLLAHPIKAPPENFCRPSIDPMFRNLIDLFGSKVLGVILTGMGHDGLHGSEALVRAGGAVIAQDEASCAVWGMPRAVATAGLCSAVLPLPMMAAEIRRRAGGRSK